MCQIVGSLLVSQRTLQEQLDLVWQYANQNEVAVMDSANRCAELEKRISEFEQERYQYEIALDEARARQMAIHQHLIEEKNTHARTTVALTAEKTLLSKIIDDINPIPSTTGQPVPVQNLLQNYQKQWKIISNLRATNEHYKMQLQLQDKEEGKCSEGDMIEIEDEGNMIEIGDEGNMIEVENEGQTEILNVN